MKAQLPRVALIAEDTAYGRGLGETIRAKATLAGIDVAPARLRARLARPAPRAKRLLVRKPDALAGHRRRDPRRARSAITQARGAGYKGDIVLGWDYVDEAFWKATGKHGVGVIWPTFSAPKLRADLRGRDVQAAYTKRYKHPPLIYQAFTWDQLNAWKWAVDTAGSIAPADVVPALPRIDMQGTMGRITLSNQPKTVHFNQWEGVTVYFDQAPKKGATDATAKVLWSTKGDTP